MFTAASRVSILKWWWAINSLNALRLRMIRCVPFFFGRKNIVEINSSVSCAAGIMTPLARSLSIPALTIECWWLLITPVTIWRIVGSAVIASHCGKKCLSFPAWKLVCDSTKLCTMSIGKVVMFVLHTSGTFIVAGSFRRPFSFSAALRSGFCQKNQRIFL